MMLAETGAVMSFSRIIEALRPLIEARGGLIRIPNTMRDRLVSGFSTDTRTIRHGDCFIALKGENFDGNLYAKQAMEKGALLCIVSEPGVLTEAPFICVQDTLAAYAAIARYYHSLCRTNGLRKTIAVTGSSGKTTVKDMTAHVLSKKFRTYATSGNHNNHIGVPYTLLHMPLDTECAVIEMGMNHAREIANLSDIAIPDWAIVTNIGTAHIGNLGSQDNIFAAKMEVTEHMDLRAGRLILPADDPYLGDFRRLPFIPLNVRYSSRCGHPDAELQASDITESAENTCFTVHYQGEAAQVSLPMTGLHNVSDALLAMHAGLLMGMPLADCAAALADFVPGAMRSERVKIGNLTIIRDYYNANPEAMSAALAAMSTIADGAKKIAVLGNMNELGDFASARHKELGERCKMYADTAFFCGTNHADFAAGYGSSETAFAEQSALTDALLAALPDLTAQPACMLIKASRGMHMERVYDAVAEAMKHS
ncbi:MAG TPA: hypothetical protein DDX71_06605 [Ruminococcus sp.]|nr:hypothetical protein [Ruminococcus sp.]